MNIQILSNHITASHPVLIHAPAGGATWRDVSGLATPTKLIPTPQEKRDGLIRDHALGLLENLHQRLARLERASKLPADEAEAFTALLARMRADESRNIELHASLITSDTASG